MHDNLKSERQIRQTSTSPPVSIRLLLLRYRKEFHRKFPVLQAAGGLRMRRMAILGITVTAVAVLLAGCRAPSSLRSPTAPPVAQPAISYQGFVPPGTINSRDLRTRGLLRSWLQLVRPAHSSLVIRPAELCSCDHTIGDCATTVADATDTRVHRQHCTIRRDSLEACVPGESYDAFAFNSALPNCPRTAVSSLSAPTGVWISQGMIAVRGDKSWTTSPM